MRHYEYFFDFDNIRFLFLWLHTDLRLQRVYTTSIWSEKTTWKLQQNVPKLRYHHGLNFPSWKTGTTLYPIHHRIFDNWPTWIAKRFIFFNYSSIRFGNWNWSPFWSDFGLRCMEKKCWCHHKGRPKFLGGEGVPNCRCLPTRVKFPICRRPF